jgi:hypothetical protein
VPVAVLVPVAAVAFLAVDEVGHEPLHAAIVPVHVVPAAHGRRRRGQVLLR